MSITVSNGTSSPDLGVCFTDATIIMFGPGTSGALDSAGGTYEFAASGGSEARQGRLEYWETGVGSSTVDTSYTVSASLLRAS